MEKTVVSLSERSVFRNIDRFLSSPYFIISVVLATLLSNYWGLELPVYTAFVLVAMYCCIFGRDLLPMIPLVACGYLAPSVDSNPGRNSESIFTWAHGGWYIAILVALLAVSLLFYILKNAKSFFARKRVLLPGMLAVCAAYLLSGIMSPAYPDMVWKNLCFAVLQGVSLLIPYYLISGGVRWNENRKDFLGWTGFGMGCVLLGQLCWIYLTGEILEDGEIVRNRIFTGWGMHNNLGGMIAMMVPFPFYLASKYRKGWIGIVAGTAFLGGVFMSCSRSSILVGTAAYAGCIAIMLIKAQNKKVVFITLGAVCVVAIAGILIFRQQLFKLFWGLISMGLDPSYRDVTWKAGMQQFLKYPIFGGSFYPIDFVPWDFSEVSDFSKIFPPRWHNTIIQLLACTGAVGLLTYVFHRFQTIRLLLKNITREKAFIGCSLLVLLGACLFDCHFFNIGPVLFYSMALAFAENCSEGMEV